MVKWCFYYTVAATTETRKWTISRLIFENSQTCICTSCGPCEPLMLALLANGTLRASSGR
jgi:hypothetical protein